VTLTPAQIDKVSDELRSMIRAEIRSRKIRKIDPSFYKSINSALYTLRTEAEVYLKNQDIGKYIQIKNRADDLERDFKSFFQRRFEKIATRSIYDLDGELMNSLTPEEKEFITELHNAMRDEYNALLSESKPVTEQNTEETAGVIEKEIVAAKPKPEADKKVIVLITTDLPPIAQPERDYFLHKNDILYLSESFADMLIKRNSARKLNLH